MRETKAFVEEGRQGEGGRQRKTERSSDNTMEMLQRNVGETGGVSDRQKKTVSRVICTYSVNVVMLLLLLPVPPSLYTLHAVK